MARARLRPTIAIWGHFHGGNLGDDLVVSTMIDAARRRVPGVAIIGISLFPADTAARHGIPAYPLNPSWSGFHPSDSASGSAPRAERLRRALLRVPMLRSLRVFDWSLQRAIVSIEREVPFLWHSYWLLRRVDIVLVAGSGVLEDGSGTWAHPYTTFRWALLARLAHVPMVFSSIGAGPIDSRLSAFFIRRAVAWADHISVRDQDAARVLASKGLPGPFPIVPDMAFGLPENLRDAAAPLARPDGGGVVVGLNVMAYQDPRYSRGGDKGRYEAYVNKMAAFTEWLLDEGHTVNLFSSQTRADVLVADDVRRVLEARERLDSQRLNCVIDQIHDVEDLIRVITGCDLVVAARFHTVLLALFFDIPVLGLAYHPKTAELLANTGQPERFVDIGVTTLSDLTEAFRALSTGDPPDRRRAQGARVAEHRAIVEQQFDAIFAPLSVVPAADRPAPQEPQVSRQDREL